MEKPKSFFIYKRDLYARKTFTKPVPGESVMSKLSDLNYIPDTRRDNRSFVVAWEILDMDLETETGNPGSALGSM